MGSKRYARKHFEWGGDATEVGRHGGPVDVPMGQLVWAAAFAAEARLHIMTADPVELTPATANECAAVADACVRLLAEVELP